MTTENNRIEGVFHSYKDAYEDYRQRYLALQETIVGKTGASGILAAAQHRKSHERLTKLLEASEVGLEFSFDGQQITEENIDSLIEDLLKYKQVRFTLKQNKELESVGKILYHTKNGVLVKVSNYQVILYCTGENWTCTKFSKPDICGTGISALEAYNNMLELSFPTLLIKEVGAIENITNGVAIVRPAAGGDRVKIYFNKQRPGWDCWHWQNEGWVGIGASPLLAYNAYILICKLAAERDTEKLTKNQKLRCIAKSRHGKNVVTNLLHKFPQWDGKTWGIIEQREQVPFAASGGPFFLCYPDISGGGTGARWVALSGGKDFSVTLLGEQCGNQH